MGSVPAALDPAEPPSLNARRTQLLVSVRTVAEARDSLEAGADWIDVKQPDNGPLGRADQQLIDEIATFIGDRAQVSAAWGELLEIQPENVDRFRKLTGLTTIKLGLSRCDQRTGWQLLWHEIRAALPDATSITPVIYADRVAAAAPSIQEVLQLAIEAQSQLILIDTFDKASGNLLSHFTVEELGRIVTEFQDAGIETVLAGSLRASDFENLLTLAPFMLAVRTAACAGGRLGTVCGERVRHLVAKLGGEIEFRESPKN